MPGYYTERLAAERLRACYDLAPPRTKAYLGTGISETQTITMPCLHGLHSNGLSRQRL